MAVSEPLGFGLQSKCVFIFFTNEEPLFNYYAHRKHYYITTTIMCMYLNGSVFRM